MTLAPESLAWPPSLQPPWADPEGISPSSPHALCRSGLHHPFYHLRWRISLMWLQLWGSQRLSWVSHPFPCPLLPPATSTAACTAGPSGTVVSHASWAGLASTASSWLGSAPWTTSSAVPVPFLSSHTSSRNHHYNICFSGLGFFLIFSLHSFYRDFKIVANILKQWLIAYYQMIW